MSVSGTTGTAMPAGTHAGMGTPTAPAAPAAETVTIRTSSMGVLIGDSLGLVGKLTQRHAVSMAGVARDASVNNNFNSHEIANLNIQGNQIAMYSEQLKKAQDQLEQAVRVWLR